MELILGTANLGLPYGHVMRRPLPEPAAVHGLLDAAWRSGIRHLDTAAAYGVSEARIGDHLRRWPEQAFRISTKTPALGLAQTTLEGIASALGTSCQRLGIAAPRQLLLHRWEQAAAQGGAVWNYLQDLRQAGAIGALGVSVQSPREAMEATRLKGVEVLQLACNHLDWRYDEPQVADCLRGFCGRIEVRSLFLQGLLAQPSSATFPHGAERYDHHALRAFITAKADRLAGGDPVRLAIGYGMALDWADALVVGADTPDQLAQLVRHYRLGPLAADAMEELRNQRPRAPESLLDPAQWISAPTNDPGSGNTSANGSKAT